MFNEISWEVEVYKHEIKSLKNTLSRHKSMDNNNFYDIADTLKNNLKNEDASDIILKDIDRLNDNYFYCSKLLEDDLIFLKKQLYVSCAVFLENVIDKFLSVLLDNHVNAPCGIRGKLDKAYRTDITGSAKIDNFKKLYEVLIDCLGDPKFSQAEEKYLRDNINKRNIKLPTKIHHIVFYRLESSGFLLDQNILDFCDQSKKGESKGALYFYDYCSIFWEHIIDMRNDISHGNSINLTLHGGYMCIDAAMFVLNLSDNIISILDLFPKKNFKS